VLTVTVKHQSGLSTGVVQLMLISPDPRASTIFLNGPSIP